ncbi:hypothetical protein TSAR_008463 [Trichomalopsis sarcophagae]|uniref:Uncharacterized protein n=1 Tax=Trichomalopsis sarcophagae TaxID=543379 RepID=A0A232FB26_9HYME|nr:hypothetical protein TSAR_008463 [Trichomalopsis sarcophagae]
MLPNKSKQSYTAADNAFKKWRKDSGTNSFCEDLTCNVYNHINIGKYKRLQGYLKKCNKGYQQKKNLMFSPKRIYPNS